MTASVLFRSTARGGRVSSDMRTLLVGIICVVTILGVGKGIPFLMSSHHATIARLRMVQDELAQDRQIISGRSAVLRSLDETATTFLGLSPAFLKGSSPSQAAADLGSVVADAADANGVHVSSIQPEIDSTAHTLIVPIIVRVTGTGDVRGVSGMLRDLESSVPLIDVRQATIAQPEPTALSDRMEALHIELTVRGLYRRVPDGSDDRVGQ